VKKVPPTKPVNWRVFGQFIFQQREADPGYYIVNYLREDGYEFPQLLRFAVAWCAFYNLGIAAWASEAKTGKAFYKRLRDVYPTAKRASERRHFRGAAGLKAIEQWEAKWPKPEALAEFIMAYDMGQIRKKCELVPQMGDYFKWKWGDLTEVLMQHPVQFRGYENKSPKVPQQGAALIAKEAGKESWDTEKVYLSITTAMRALGVESAYAPWRAFDVQDAETICCVYKQYRTGGYIPGLRTAKAATRLHHDGQGTITARDALQFLLANQPQPVFREPGMLNAILQGETLSIKDLMET
jgi:hypothetical protein